VPHVSRSFRRTSDDTPPPLLRHLSAKLTWDDLLAANSAVVLVAPSQAGKSTELTQLASSLRSSGRHAILCEASAAATQGLPNGLDHPEAKAWALWCDCTEPLVLLIDAVDELYLRGSDFQTLLRRLHRDVNLATRAATLVFTARNGSWPVTHTGALTSLFQSLGKADTKIELVTFDALDPDGIRAIAVAYGVRDPDSFIRELNESEVDSLIALRPIDIRLVVRHWQHRSRFGKWSDILADYLESACVSDRAEEARVSPADVRVALKRIAAACTFMRTPHLTLPHTPPIAGTVASRRLFDDWPYPKLAELFEGPIFTPKGTDAVQLPQGALPDFLAARWLVDRFKAGMAREELGDAIFVRLFDNKVYLPPSRRPVAGWIASELPEFRSLVIDACPRAALFEGDPDRLRDEDIQTAFRLYEAESSNLGGWHWPSRGTLKKLARPTLEQFFLEVVQRPSLQSSVRLQIWVLAQVGRYQSFLPSALAVAKDEAAPLHERTAAISLIREIGDDQHVAQLLSLTAEEAPELRHQLLLALAPKHLAGSTLLDFLRKPTDVSFTYYLRQVAEALPLQTLDTLLLGLLPASHAPALLTDHLATLLALLVELRLTVAPTLTADVTRILLALEHSATHAESLSSMDLKELDKLIGDDQSLRRALWDARFAAANGSPQDFLILSSVEFGDIRAEDGQWLVAKVPQHAPITDPLVNRLLHVLDRAGPDVHAALTDAALPVAVKDWITARKRGRQAMADAEAQRQTKEAEQRTKLQTELASRRSQIETGNDLAALLWAYHELGHREGPIDLTKLREQAGPDNTISLAKGFKASWRVEAVPLPSPVDNRIPNAVIAGQIGVTLDVQDGLQFSTLAPEEVDRAARYALWALNGFPFWFSDLLAAHPTIVEGVLREAVALDWASTADRNCVLGWVQVAPPDIAAVLRTIVLELLHKGSPVHTRTIHNAVDALITSNQGSTVAGELIAREVTASNDEDHLTEWLRAWAHFDPLRCAKWIECQEGRVTRLVEATAGLLEQDFDERLEQVRSSALLAPHALEHWVRLALRAVHPDDDIHHSDVFSPGTRDHAQDFRNRVINALAKDPSPRAALALQHLFVNSQMQSFRPLLARCLGAQREAGSEALAVAWTEGDILRVEHGDERTPRSISELYIMAQRHIRDVARIVENDDFSYRGIFTPTTKEREIQLWVASTLSQRSQGLYSIVRENVVDDDKEVDIFALADGVGQIPIEIKPLGDYSIQSLVDTLKNQLLGQYMRPRDRPFGVLLLVCRDRRFWHYRKRRLTFPEMVAELNRQARKLGAKYGKGLVVIPIDLRPPET